MADDNKAQDLDLDLELDEINELDEDLTSYGVFVKAGPEDIQEENSVDELSDLQEEDELSAELNEEEEILLASLEESELSDEETPEVESIEDSASGDSSMPDIEGLDDLDNLEGEITLSLDDDEEDDTVYLEEDELKLDLEESTAVTHSDDELVEDDNIVIPDLDMGALSDGEEITLDIENMDEPADDFMSEELSLPEEPSEDTTADEEVSLDDFMENSLTLEEDDEDDDQLSAIDLDNSEGEIDLSDDELDIDIDLDEEALELDAPDENEDQDIDDSIADLNLPGAEDDVVSIEDVPDTDYSEDLAELEADGIEISGEGEEFDDVAALTESLDETDSLVDSALAATDDIEQSESSLSNIEQELSAIKSELTDLREELHRLRSAGAGNQVETEPETAVETEFTIPESSATDDNSADGGFFSSDDDDETIALTGDELDNILNTAEFIEETGESTYEPEEEIAFEDGTSDGQSITAVDSGAEDPFKGSDEEIQAMADLNIEEELSDIDDLKDDEEEIQLYTGDELEEMELEIPEISDSAVIDGEIEDSGIETEIIDEDDDDIQLVDDSMLSLDDEPEVLNLDEEPSFDSTDAEELPTEELSNEEEDLLTSSLDTEVEELDLSADDSIEEIDIESIDEPTVAADSKDSDPNVTGELKHELKAVLTYMDSLLENLPEEKIEEFAQSEHFATYQKLFEELGL